MKFRFINNKYQSSARMHELLHDYSPSVFFFISVRLNLDLDFGNLTNIIIGILFCKHDKFCHSFIFDKTSKVMLCQSSSIYQYIISYLGSFSILFGSYYMHVINLVWKSRIISPIQVSLPHTTIQQIYNFVLYILEYPHWIHSC